MVTQISPGIVVTEINDATSVTSAPTDLGATAGVYRWGPVGKVGLVYSETDLVNKYGKPTNFNAETWFSAANYLSYSNQLYISRAAGSNTYSAVANTGTANNAALTVNNIDAYDSVTFNSNVQYVARYPGELGNSLKVSVCDSANSFGSVVNLQSNSLFTSNNTVITLSVGSKTANVVLANNAALTGNTPLDFANTIVAKFQVGDIVTVGNNSIGTQDLKIVTIGSVNVQNTAGTNTGFASFDLTFDSIYRLSTDYVANTVDRKWEYYSFFDRAPGQSSYQSTYGNTSAQDEIHVIVSDEDGKFSAPGSVLELYSAASRATDSKTENGTTNYYKNVINSYSNYIYFASDRTGAVSNTAVNLESSTNLLPLTLSFVGGTDGPDESNITIADLGVAYDLLKNTEDFDISLVFTGKALGGTAGEQLFNYVIDNLAAERKDIVVFGSPEYADVVNNTDAVNAIVNWASYVRASSYAVLDSGYKYQYDRYNDVYRYIPLNADVAGTCVGIDPWLSPAGTTRGFIKNVAKLAFNPAILAQRNILYKNRVNPVVTLKGTGTVLYGDKTALDSPSAFDRINVRRLFIYLEKSISQSAKQALFELNNDITRLNFVNSVEPFMRIVKGSGGIYDFAVICDDTNNTGAVVDANKFVGSIYVKPARSINFIELQFTAVGTSVDFNTIIGK